MTYARSRLWLGISGVGLQVVLAVVGVGFDLPHRLLDGLSAAAAISLTLLCFIVVSIPSDVLGGYILPRAHGRSRISFGRFAAGWMRGVLTQAAVMGVCAGALIEAARTGGRWAAFACFAGLMLVLIVAQEVLARVVGGLRVSGRTAHYAHNDQPPGGTTVLAASDPGFSGGYVGLPGWERLMLPEAWATGLAAEMMAAELLRRKAVLANGTRSRGVVEALGFNLAGFYLVSHLAGADLTTGAGMVQLGLCMTCWSFVGLMLNPSFNRPAVFAADRYALEHGVAPEVLAGTIRRLDSLQDDEPARSRWVERIFHPIPAADARIAALDEPPKTHRGEWQGARTTLYLSWACFGFLARAVHCNAGRPELWVLYPGD